MSRRERPEPDEDFGQKLQKLRLRIDLLPAEQRPHLYALADVIAEQQRRLQNKKLGSNDSD